MKSFGSCNCLNWVGLEFLTFLSPLSHPRLSLAPPGEKEEPTATFGRVFFGGKYPIRGTLASKWLPLITARQHHGRTWRSARSRLPVFPPKKTRPNVAISSPFRPGGGGEGLGERGGIQRINNENSTNVRGGRLAGMRCSTQREFKNRLTAKLARGSGSRPRPTTTPWLHDRQSTRRR